MFRSIFCVWNNPVCVLDDRSKCKNELTAPDWLKVAAKPRKGEKIHKFNILNGDFAKYMSCIKVIYLLLFCEMMHL